MGFDLSNDNNDNKNFSTIFVDGREHSGFYDMFRSHYFTANIYSDFIRDREQG